MILTPVLPRAGAPIDLDHAGARESIAQRYRTPREDWLRLNLIASVSGSAAGPDGTSETLSNATDRLVLKVIRSLADVVLVGAASVRSEGYFVPKDGTLAIVTRSGDFSGHHIRDTGHSGDVLVLAPASAVATARATIGLPDVTVVAVEDIDVNGILSAPGILAALRSRGFRSIVAEGGPALGTHLVLGGVVDELCLTTSPVLNGGDLPLFGTGRFDAHPLSLTQLLVDSSGFSYARWALGQPT